MTSETPHDALFRAVFGAPEHAAEYFASFLPAEVARHLDLRAPERISGTFIDERFLKRHSDLLYGVRFRGRPGLLYVLFEHQSTVERLMAFRLLGYMVRIWEQWLTEHPKAHHLPPIVPLVLYQGRRRWTAALELGALIGGGAELSHALAPFLPRFEYVLTDLSACADNDIPGRSIAGLALRLMKHVHDRDLLRHLPGWFEAVPALLTDAPSCLRVLACLVEYLLETTELEHDALGAALCPVVGPKVEEVIMTGAEKLRQEGRQEGLDEGREEGRRALLLRQLGLRFGELPPTIAALVAGAKAPALEQWAERILTAASLDDIFAPGRK